MLPLPGLTAIIAAAGAFLFGYALHRRWIRKHALSGVAAPQRRVPTALVTPGLMQYVYWLLAPVERALVGIGMSPAALTLVGLALSAAAGVFAAVGAFGAAGVLYLASGALDVLDGRVARSSKRDTPAGALLDSVCDRWAEFATLGGIAFSLRSNPSGVVAVLLATAGSQMVSYTRARAEALGASPALGLMQRSERIVICGIGLLVAGAVDGVGPRAAAGVLTLVLFAVGFISVATAIRRLVVAMAAVSARRTEP
jgi:CDP-diacylglycerol--glycerol-3-phosphate 3-phosphatidyltransferase